jgi:hypothetical protein
VTVCSFQTSSEHSTSLGRVRYQHCVCGRFRMLLDSDVLKEGPCEAAHANRIPNRSTDSSREHHDHEPSREFDRLRPSPPTDSGGVSISAHADGGVDRLRPK